MSQPSQHWLSWPHAELHGVSPYSSEHGEIGIYLRVNGEVVRYRLGAGSAYLLAQMLGDYLPVGPVRCQSETSEGRPNCDVSTPTEGQ